MEGGRWNSRLFFSWNITNLSLRKLKMRRQFFFLPVRNFHWKNFNPDKVLYINNNIKCTVPQILDRNNLSKNKHKAFISFYNIEMVMVLFYSKIYWIQKPYTEIKKNSRKQLPYGFNLIFFNSKLMLHRFYTVYII